MNITRVPVSQLVPSEKNVRIHSAKQIEEFKRSIQMFDQIRPIVCDEKYTILAGNGLYATLKEMGRTEADCYIVKGLSEVEKKKLMLADNRIFSLGVDDLQAFDEILLELDHDFDIPGYDSSLLETLTISLDEADDYMAGYGIISDESKAQMQKAAEKYGEEDAEFSKTYEEYKPVAPQKPLESVSNAPESNNHIGASVVPETPQETPQNALQRRYILCPKCGEKIWL